MSATEVFRPFAELRRWVAWKYERRGDDDTKPPYSPVTGTYASSTNPETWSTLPEAMSYAEEDGMEGVGIVLGDGLGGVDLDACRDPQTGEITTWARKIIDGFGSYAEVSPSGTGVKVFAVGAPSELPASTIPMDTPPINGKRPAIETYVSGRYFSVTGRALDGDPGEIRDCGELGDAWDRMVRLLRERSSNGSAPETDAPSPTGVTEISAEVQDALRSNAKLSELWREGKDGGADRSRNDASLAATLASMGYGDEDVEAAIRSYPLGQVGQGALKGRAADRQVGRLLKIATEARATFAPHQNGADPSERMRLHVVDAPLLERIGRSKTEPVDAVPVPWPSWKNACRGAGGGEGLARSWHVIVGASSGAGKSLWAMNMVAKAIRSGIDTCLFSLEMSEPENLTRLLAIATGTPAYKLEHGKGFSLESWNQATERVMEYPGILRTNERPIHQLHQIREAMKHHAEEGCRLMIVDYLQLAWVGSAETLYQQITEVSHTIQGLAKELNLTTVGLSQVNRRTSSGESKLAKEGLMGGSSLENDAEQVILLGRPEPYPGGGYKSSARLDKNRHGPSSEWDVLLNTQTLQIDELT